MSIKDLIKESIRTKKELVPVTVRITKEMQSFVEDLIEDLSSTKQEILFSLVEDGIKVAEEELKLSEVVEKRSDVDCAYFLLNTNKRHDINDQDDMISNQFAAAYYDPWKKNIDRINKNDYVFLYQNGVGIVAYGKGTGNVLKKEKYGEIDECHYMKLNEFKLLEKPLKASEIKKVLDRPVVFLRTMTEMPTGKKLLNYLEKF